MSLVINAPAIEVKLRQEAAKQGVSAADFATKILTEHLGPSAAGDNNSMPFYAGATREQWEQALDRWIGGHPARKPLPDAALSRESIYEGRA
jgi:hypothetical protein